MGTFSAEGQGNSYLLGKHGEWLRNAFDLRVHRLTMEGWESQSTLEDICNCALLDVHFLNKGLFTAFVVERCLVKQSLKLVVRIVIPIITVNELNG